MKKPEPKYPDAVIRDLSSVFALKDSNAIGYLSGPKLTTLFNGLGFPDSYQYPNIGITTPEGSGLSRIQYVKKRLSDLNEMHRLPEAITAYQKLTNNISSITEVFDRYKLESPIQMPKTAGSLIQSEKSVAELNAGLVLDHTMKQSGGDKPGITQEKIDSVFDEIPPGEKVAFISYSWENEKDDSHKDWVRKLAEDLIGQGIYVLLDQYLLEGYPLIHFMNKGMDIADKILVIGTPTYRKKSIEATGGVAYEGSIIQSGVFSFLPTTKVIPISRKGNFQSGFPPTIGSRNGFDFSDDSKYKTLLDELVRAICDVPKYPRPKLGQLPNFGYGDLSDSEREKLKSPQSDFRKTQDRKIIEKLIGNFSFPLMDSLLTEYPNVIDERVFISLDIWNAIIDSSTFRIYDPKLNDLIRSFHTKWKESAQVGYKFYSTMPGQRRVKFEGLKGDLFVNDDAETAFNRIIEIHQSMQPLLRELAIYVMDNFEIDIEETSNEFIKHIDNNIPK